VLAGRDAADVGLDRLERGDPAQAIVIKDLFQFTPCMRPEMGH
jgi:hypothetical protein